MTIAHQLSGAVVNGRVADHPIAPMFLERWSARAFTDEVIGSEDLLTMLEAARWAASSYNVQPWRFVYELRDGPHWRECLDLLVPANRTWARHAAALVFFVSRAGMHEPGSDVELPSPTHAYDTGTASGYFALQANLMGWAVHGMVGFDQGRAMRVLAVPPNHAVQAVYGVGRRGNASLLPEKLRTREHASGRLPLGRLAFRGQFPIGSGEQTSPESH